MSSLKVIGIDPGSQITGYGLLEETGNRIQFLEAGIIDVRHESDFNLRLQHIHQHILEIINRHRPCEAAIESPFQHKNIQSTLKLGKTIGVISLAVTSKNIPLVEYPQRTVKQRIVGSGSAEKEQVQYMISSLLHIPKESSLDATDALAVAWCHLHHWRLKKALQRSKSDFSSYRTNS